MEYKQASSFNSSVRSVHFHLSTGCRSEANALKEYSRWEADPAGYSRGERVDVSRLDISVDLLEEFFTWQTTRRHVSEQHALASAGYLRWWAHQFRGADLRRITLHGHVKPALEHAETARRYRVIALKAFCTWLRREKGLLTRAEDPAIDLQVPPARPAQQHRRRGADRDVVQLVLGRLAELATQPAAKSSRWEFKGNRWQVVHDVVKVLSTTGLHISELRRLVAGIGSLRQPTPRQRAEGAVAVLTVQHKSDDLHVIAITDIAVQAAAERLIAEGALPAHATITRTLKGVGAQFAPGGLRHSFGTWLVEDGAPIEHVSEVLGHRSSATARRFYVDVGSAARVVTPKLKLVR
jgi:integrase